ncbi:MAG: hypothetical protein ABGZ35_20300 [Planctomycetaceae bacterium]|jgi:hypothetical protein
MIAVSPAMNRLATIPEADRPRPWSVIGRFNTIEAAEQLLDRLGRQGVEACLSLIGGLSVLARSDDGAAAKLLRPSRDYRTLPDRDQPSSARDNMSQGDL